MGLIPRPVAVRGGLSARARKDIQKDSVEKSEPLDLSIDSLFKIPFTDISLFTPNIIEAELNRVAKFTRREESVENLALRYITGLPIRDEDIQELKDPKDVSVLDIISTTGKIKESVKELIPEVEPPDFDEKMRLPGTEVGKILVNVYREVFAEMADLTGLVIRPSQMFGILPLLNIGFRFVGGRIKDLVGIIKRSGIKKGMTVEKSAEVIKRQMMKESGISQEKIDKEIGKFFSFKDKTGKSNIELSEGGSRFIKAQAESKIAAEQAKKTTVKQAVNFLDKKLIDVSGEVRRKLLNASDAGKHAVIMKDVTRGATGNAARIYNDVKTQIYENGLSRSEVEQLHAVIRARRTIGIARFKDVKNPRGAGADTAMDLMADIEKNPLLFNKLQERANVYFKEMRRNLKRLKDEGLIDESLHENLLKKGDYSKRQFIDKIDPEISSIDRGGNKITVRDSGLQKLKEGSEGLIETDTSLMLQQVIARTEGRIAKNNANKALMKFADDFPDNGIVFLEKPKPLNITELEFFHKNRFTLRGEFAIDEIKAVVRGDKPAHYKAIKDKAAIAFAKKQKGVKVIENVTPSGDYVVVKNTKEGSRIGQRLVELSKKRESIFATKDEELINKWNDEFSRLLGFEEELIRTISGVGGFGDTRLEANRIFKHKLEESIAEASKSFETVSVMIEGKPQQMFMPKEFAAQWVNSAPEVTGALGAAMRWGTGSSILRASATGMNPGFAITNFAMDMSHQFLITSEYSSFFPKAFAQMGRNAALVFKDAITRTGRYIDYANEGGLMPFMTHQGRIGFTPGSIWAKMQTYAGWAGETSEIFGRLMLREQSMLNGKLAQEATWIARNYLDFSQGGSWTKFVDAGVPYLSASVQGTRGIFRAGSEAMKGGIKGEAEFVFKFAQISAASAGLYFGWKFMYPESYKDLSPHDKRNFWNIPTPYKFKDENGADRRYYFKIAKDPGQKVFALLTESLLGKFIDDKDIDFEEQADAFTELIPITFNRLPPIMNAILGYAVNKDFWLNDDIWKGTENIKANREFHITGSQKTNPVFREIGRFSTFGTRETDAELEGLSPERTKFFLQQFFTRGNLWTAIMGNGANVIFNELPESFQDLATEEIIQKQPIIKRFLGVTRPLASERKRFKEIEKIENTKDFAIRQQFEVLSKNVIKGKNNLFELNRFIREQPISNQAKKRLLRKHTINRQVDKIKDNVAFWKRLGGVNDPESRAKIYFEFFNAAGDKVKKELNRDLNRIPGIRSEAFQIELGDLKREKKE
ncbi:hypothetical protein LCGC14_1033160 [marine sediment metagenome]|uniref:Large polyvalent protein associated domain-containing protein n=1 Tax=marine sediment metagenome TaxID=412755 RepID=A0A0F9R040_9ZZZZ